MSTITATQTFTRTHAKHLASKVVADLYQCARLYGKPRTDEVADYETELVELLVGGYVAEYEFGFKKNGKRVVTWQYRVNAYGDLVGGGADDRAGGVYARAKVADATHFNFLSYSQKWRNLTPEARKALKDRLPIRRSPGALPADGNGYWVSDRTYSSGGVAVSRRTFRPR